MPQRQVAPILLALVACAPGTDGGDPLPAGHYEGIGMTDDGSGFHRDVLITDSGSARGSLTATLGPDSVAATVATAGDTVVLAFAAPVRGTGFLVELEPGHLEGRWSLDDGRTGWEVLRRRLSPDSAPVVRERYDPAEGTIEIGPGTTFPRTDLGYSVLLPPGDAAPRGVLVLFDGFRVRDAGLPPAAPSIEGIAPTRGVAILRITTGDPLDFLFTDAAVDTLLTRIDAALATEGLGGLPLAFAGLSLAGTRAARAAIRVRERGIPLADRVRALVLVDAPLDFARMHASERKAMQDDVHPAAAGEAAWVTFRLEQALGGPPERVRAAYEAYSPLSLSLPDGGRAHVLAGLPVRAYHEPDIDWWLVNRGKDYTQINSIDLARLVDRLNALGGPAELITSHHRRDGWRFGSTPHTWSFVDNAELMGWFLGVAGVE